ncbi:MAG: hypothetical protein COT74_11165 [Bdellovibrionales bacterium CG10_big_fil_rev_8_21_14_0_10_45_34]|nr:MAG: hypothetical protein COT74_11165 [Bdellovibrionales bacterium CG10_big_fil_rev_8_21_14_0_10_45_34]
MSLKVFSLNERELWTDALSELETHLRDVYFTPDYYQLHQNYGDGVAECALYSGASGCLIYAYLKNPIRPLGYDLPSEHYDIQGAYGYNGLAGSLSDHNELSKFHSEFSNYCRDSNIVAEFTRFHPLIENVNYSRDHLSVRKNRSTVKVILDRSFIEIQKEFSDSCRRAIRKAEKNGIKITTHTSSFHIADFKRLYKATMDRTRSRPYLYFSDSYFEELFRVPNLVQFCAWLDDKVVATSLCFLSTPFFHYHLGASATEHLSMRPNNLLFQEMISFANARGAKLLHLGGGNTASPDDSLFKYKTSYSHALCDFYVGYKIHDEETYKNLCDEWDRKANLPKLNTEVLRYRSSI